MQAKEETISKYFALLRQRHALFGVTRAMAWGANFYGQLGDESTIDRLGPVPVKNLGAFRTIAGGAGYTLALKEDGTV